MIFILGFVAGCVFWLFVTWGFIRQATAQIKQAQQHIDMAREIIETNKRIQSERWQKIDEGFYLIPGRGLQ